MNIIEKIVATFSWQKALGHEVRDTGLCRIVRNLDHPLIWDANHVILIRTAFPREIDRVFDEAAELLCACGHSVVHIDPLTPPLVEARLADEDYEDHTPILQMVLSGPIKAKPKNIDVRPVVGEGDWASLGKMIHENFVETGPKLSPAVALDVSRGLLAANRLKEPDFQFCIARLDGQDCGYGGGGFCPDGMGMVEDIFTRPAFRNRGVATAVIARAAKFARRQGAKDLMIGTDASDTVKHFYADLGFQPACVTRQYVKEKPGQRSD